MNIDLFDPTVSPEKEPIQYVSRPKNLNGLKVGLVDNTKFNSRALLIKISERLETEFNTETVQIVTKQSAGHPIEDAAVDEIKAKADVVIAGIGD